MKKFNLFNHEDANDKDAKAQRQKIVDEFIRQARLTFNVALGVTTAAAIMTLLGVGLLYVDKIPEASLTAGTGIIASIGSVQFAKEAREELQDILDNSRK